MLQQTLFTDTPRARRSDPATSHLAAERVKASGKLASQQQAVLQAIRTWPGCTAVEIAQRARIDRYAVSRRTSELCAVKIRKGDPRICSVAGTMQVTWWPL